MIICIYNHTLLYETINDLSELRDLWTNQWKFFILLWKFEYFILWSILDLNMYSRFLKKCQAESFPRMIVSITILNQGFI